MSILFNVVTGVAIALMIPAGSLVSAIMVLPANITLKWEELPWGHADCSASLVYGDV
ncbi:MAG: hypothetical protein ACLS3V_00670 [Streptococcus sp.]